MVRRFHESRLKRSTCRSTSDHILAVTMTWCISASVSCVLFDVACSTIYRASSAYFRARLYSSVIVSWSFRRMASCIADPTSNSPRWCSTDSIIDFNVSSLSRPFSAGPQTSSALTATSVRGTLMPCTPYSLSFTSAFFRFSVGTESSMAGGRDALVFRPEKLERLLSLPGCKALGASGCSFP